MRLNALAYLFEYADALRLTLVSAIATNGIAASTTAGLTPSAISKPLIMLQVAQAISVPSLLAQR